jgi:hypothetical protein
MYYTGKYEWWKCKERQEGLDHEQSTDDYIKALYRNGIHLRNQDGLAMDVDNVIHPENMI